MIKPFAMFPVLVANDLAKLKDFYEHHFGFKSEFYQHDFYLHLLQPEAKIQLAFMAPNLSSQPEFLHSPANSTGMVISLEVVSAKVAFDKAQKVGLDISLDLKVEDFGITHFMITDPAGFVIDIVEHHAQ